MSEQEKRLLHALAVMVRQYLERRDVDILDNSSMSAGEEAMELLAEYGVITIERGQARTGHWTVAGRALLDSN